LKKKQTKKSKTPKALWHVRVSQEHMVSVEATDWSLEGSFLKLWRDGNVVAMFTRWESCEKVA